MASEVALIDEIVNRVLIELRTAEAAAPAAPAKEAAPAERPPVGEVTFTTPVITGELLSQVNGSVKKVRVAPKAILTPSARDVIRQRGLEIVREAGSSAKPVGIAWRVVISSAGAHVDAALDALRSGGIGFDRQLSGTTEEAVSASASALCRGEVKGIVLLTGAPELAACLANRSDRVRAVALRDIAALEDIRRQLEPNLVALGPGNRNTFELRQILKGVVGV